MSDYGQGLYCPYGGRQESGNGDLTKCGEMVTDNAENFIKNNNVKAVVLFGTCLTKLPNMDTTKC